MAYTCKGICDRVRKLYPAKYLKQLNQKRFIQGWKWCRLCSIAEKTERLLCFCCSVRLRVRVHTRAVFEDRLPEQRVCAVCDGTDTYTGVMGYQMWKCYGDRYICTTCDGYVQYRKRHPA